MLFQKVDNENVVLKEGSVYQFHSEFIEKFNGILTCLNKVSMAFHIGAMLKTK